MSSSNLEMKWIKFGKNLRSIGGLLILIIIPYIAFVALIVQLILIIVLLNNINDINRELKNPFLDEFRSRYLAASIIKFIGAIILHLACVMLVGILSIGFLIPPRTPFGPFIRFIPIIILFIVGFILMIIGSSIEIGAWDNLKMYIVENKESFQKMGNKAIEGVENIRSGAMLWVLGFLIIPIVIGWIYQISGYFTLGDQIPVISIEPIRAVEPQHVYVSAPTHSPKYVSTLAPVSTRVQDTEDLINFCPLCGANVPDKGKYCGECGAPVRD